jgi:hypothetical protein
MRPIGLEFQSGAQLLKNLTVAAPIDREEVLMNRSIIRVPVASLTVAFALCIGTSTMAADCASPKLINSLPMEKVPGSDLMTVTTTIEGSPEKLLVDIGTMSTQLWNTQAANLKLPVEEGRRSMDLGGRFSEDSARVASFMLGSMKTGYFHIQVYPDADFANPGTDGVLGTDMMQPNDIDLDFAHQRLNLFSPEECNEAGIYWAPSTITPMKMETYAGVVYVAVALDGHKIIALLDTGSDRTFLNPQTARELFSLKADSLKAGNVTAGGALIKAGMYAFSALEVGGLTFNNPQIAIPFDIMSQSTREFHASRILRDRFTLSEIQPDMVIGMDILKQTHLYISFRDERVYVSPAGQGVALKPEPIKSHWFNVWRYGYDTYLTPYRHKFVGL